MNHNFCKPLKICMQVKSRKKTPKFLRFDAAASFSVMNVWLLRAEKTVNQSGVALIKCRWIADKMFALGCPLLTSFGVK